MRKSIPYSCPVCASRLPRAASRCFFCEHPLPLHKGPATARVARAAPRVGGLDDKPQDLPRLHVAVQDFGQLETLAYVTLDREPGGNLLRSELDRAIVCDETPMPHGTVRMGSIVTLQDRGEDGSTLRIRGVLVYPGERHRTRTSIPVSTPLGAALVGLSTGDTMPYEGADGLRHVVTVLSAVVPAPDDDPPTDAADRDATTGHAAAQDEAASRIIAFPPVRRPKAGRPPSGGRDEPPPAA